jgi:hypothetical protein
MLFTFTWTRLADGEEHPMAGVVRLGQVSCHEVPPPIVSGAGRSRSWSFHTLFWRPEEFMNPFDNWRLYSESIADMVTGTLADNRARRNTAGTNWGFPTPAASDDGDGIHLYGGSAVLDAIETALPLPQPQILVTRETDSDGTRSRADRCRRTPGQPSCSATCRCGNTSDSSLQGKN